MQEYFKAVDHEVAAAQWRNEGGAGPFEYKKKDYPDASLAEKDHVQKQFAKTDNFPD